MRNPTALAALIETMRSAARVLGMAIAVVADGAVRLAQGYGYRDLQQSRAVSADTRYPIASTSKPINATLLGMLVDEGKLSWDTPIQEYLPHFRLGDVWISAHVTVRDLITMRTGLPRHDWLWIENPMARAELVRRLRYLELSAKFREKFQYNNLTATAAGHIAEVVTGQSWEALVQRRIFEPLQMQASTFARPDSDNVTLSYHENARRELVLSRALASEHTAPSGGAIHSTVQDMALWMLFNLNGGWAQGKPLIACRTLAEIHSPQILFDPIEPSEYGPAPAYALGWFVDTYRGRRRLSHGGYLHDVDTSLMMFPDAGIGIVSFSNFGCPAIARAVNECVFDHLVGLRCSQALEHKLADYEKRIEDTRRRNASVHRVAGTAPSHSLGEYAGVYDHPAYGTIEIGYEGRQLTFRRNSLALPLEHWHFDAWIAKDGGPFFIHLPHAFDPGHPFVFETNARGDIDAVSIRLEAAVAPIRFSRRAVGDIA